MIWSGCRILLENTHTALCVFFAEQEGGTRRAQGEGAAFSAGGFSWEPLLYLILLCAILLFFLSLSLLAIHAPSGENLGSRVVLPCPALVGTERALP